MSEPRILITGSRDWTDIDIINAAIWNAWWDLGCEDDAILIHGDCPTGADKIAGEVWRFHIGTEPETHPADWTRGRRAGPERNAHMVSLGADLCLAFIGPCTSPRCSRTDPHDSHGASGCAALAEGAGIPTLRYRPAAADRDGSATDG